MALEPADALEHAVCVHRAQDGGLLAIHILRKWPAAGQLWLTKETPTEKLTPKHVAQGAWLLQRHA